MQLFAKNLEDLPHVFRIGDIIRVHRVNVSDFQNQLNLNGNVYINTAWVIFSGNPDYQHSYDNDNTHLLQSSRNDCPTNGFIKLLDEETEMRLL